MLLFFKFARRSLLVGWPEGRLREGGHGHGRVDASVPVQWRVARSGRRIIAAGTRHGLLVLGQPVVVDVAVVRIDLDGPRRMIDVVHDGTWLGRSRAAHASSLEI